MTQSDNKVSGVLSENFKMFSLGMVSSFERASVMTKFNNCGESILSDVSRPCDMDVAQMRDAYINRLNHSGYSMKRSKMEETYHLTTLYLAMKANNLIKKQDETEVSW